MVPQLALYPQKRRSLQQFTDSGELTCARFHKAMVTLQPHQIDDDVAIAIEDLYVVPWAQL